MNALEHDPKATLNYCLEHLKREETVLNGCCHSLQQVREALRANNGDALLAAVDAQQRTEKHLHSLQADRARLTNHLAVALDVPGSHATIGRLLRRLDGNDRFELQRARRQVRMVSKAVERLCRGNAALISHRMEMIRRLLYALGAANTGAYQKTGEADVASVATKERFC